MNINEIYKNTKRPIKIMQFGEGNFLRCFVDWIIDRANYSESVKLNANIVVVQPLSYGMIEGLKKQDGVYTTILEGILDNKEVQENKVIDNLGDFINPYSEYEKYLGYAKSEDLKFVVSNTTEAGIVLDENDTDFSKTPNTYPGKLLALLKERYDYFKGDSSKGLDIITCELIDKNGDELKRVLNALSVVKGYDESFIDWLNNANNFYNTLVDRIVPGYPKAQVEELREKLGYIDNFMVKGEIFHLWVIEDHHNLKDRLPLYKVANVKFVDDVTLYKERKVRILNGSHTLLVPVSYLNGHDTVLESMLDEDIRGFVKGFIFKEVIPTIDLPHDDMVNFANSVIERYSNPFIRHELMSISLNSMTKINTRLMDTIKKNVERGYLPKNALYSFASWMVFYRGKRGNETIALNDDPKYLEFFKELWESYDKAEINEEEIVKKVFSLGHWDYDLLGNKEVVDFTVKSLKIILKEGTINDFFRKELDFSI